MANICSHEDCDRPKVSRGMCSKHYNRWHRKQKPPSPPCTIEGCEREQHARQFCSTHYQQWWKTGDAEQRLRAPAGSGYVNPRGYREFQVGGRKTYEHRIVMEKMLGRELLPGETVHHINGDKLDNRPENLELWVTSHLYGQRVKDVLPWAREIVARYEGMLFIP